MLSAADACMRLVERLRRAGTDAAITVYPGAHHAFDAAANPNMTRIPDMPGNDARCTYEETSAGVIVNVETGRAPDNSDRCVGKGLIAGYNPAADAAVKVAVKAFLIQRFGLKP